MFMSRLAPMHDERGAALIAVIALTAVTAVIGVTITAATVHALGTTTSSRASVDSRAAAEAGIDVATVGLQTDGDCAAKAGVYSSATAPKYQVKIQYDAGAGWVAGCPIDKATKVRIVSTGTAQAAAVAGHSAGDTTVLEAIYNYLPIMVTIPEIDAAVYAYSIQGALKNFVLSSSDNTLASDVQIAHGNVDCTNGASISGDLILGDGHALLDNCDITGTVHVSDYVELTGASEVFGDVIAVGVKKDGAGDVAATVRSGSIVDGSVLAGGSVNVKSSSASLVKGSVTVAGTSTSVGTVESGSKIMGNLISSGSTNAAGNVQGTTTSNVTGLETPPLPRIPTWTDIPWVPGVTTWAAQGYTTRTWNGACTIDGADPDWLALSTLTTPTVVDLTTKCGSAGLTTNSNLSPITLNTNIAFIGQQFNFNKLYLSSLTPRTVNFVVPDNTADGQPTCPGPAPVGNITFSNEANFSSTIAALAYTPCKVYSDRDGWRGQIYAGEVEFGQQAKLTYVPVTVPGVNFNNLPPLVEQDGAKLGNRVSLRELAG